jgi:hypothetical protein
MTFRWPSEELVLANKSLGMVSTSPRPPCGWPSEPNGFTPPCLPEANAGGVVPRNAGNSFRRQRLILPDWARDYFSLEMYTERSKIGFAVAKECGNPR